MALLGPSITGCCEDSPPLRVPSSSGPFGGGSLLLPSQNAVLCIIKPNVKFLFLYMTLASCLRVSQGLSVVQRSYLDLREVLIKRICEVKHSVSNDEGPTEHGQRMGNRRTEKERIRTSWLWGSAEPPQLCLLWLWPLLWNQHFSSFKQKVSNTSQI